MAREWGPPQHHANPPMEKPSASTSWQGLASNSISSIVDYLRGTGKTNPPATATNSSYTLADGYITGVPMYVNGPDGNYPVAGTDGEPSRNVDGEERDSVEITRKTVHREKYKKKPDGMEEDYDLLHLQSLLPFIKQIPDKQKLDCRNYIQEIVQHYAYCVNPCDERPPDQCHKASKSGEKGQEQSELQPCKPKDGDNIYIKKHQYPRRSQSPICPDQNSDLPKGSIPSGNGSKRSGSQPDEDKLNQWLDDLPNQGPPVSGDSVKSENRQRSNQDDIECEDSEEESDEDEDDDKDEDDDGDGDGNDGNDNGLYGQRQSLDPPCPAGTQEVVPRPPLQSYNFDNQQRNSTGRRGHDQYPPNNHSDYSNYQYQEQFSPSRQYSNVNNPGQAQNNISRRPDVPDYNYQQQRGPNNSQQQMQRQCVPIRNQGSPNMYCPP